MPKRKLKIENFDFICPSCKSKRGLKLQRQVVAVLTEPLQIDGYVLRTTGTHRPDMNILKTVETQLVCSECKAVHPVPDDCTVEPEIKAHDDPYPCPRCGEHDLYTIEEQSATRDVRGLGDDGMLIISGDDRFADGFTVCLWCASCGYEYTWSDKVSVDWV
jgi:uncharacterized protein YbaR (Trm112 family)